MKKLVLATLVVFSIGVFATEITAKTYGSWGFDLNRDSDVQTFALAKTYTDASYTIGDSKIVGTVRWDKIANATAAAPASPAALDYLLIDTPVGSGMLRIGKQRLGLGNYGKGIPQTTPFLTATCLKETGVSYADDMFGLPTKVFLAKSVFFLDKQGTSGEGKGALGVLVDTKMGSKIGVIYQADTFADKAGTSVYADYVASLMGVNFQLQGFYDLSDEAEAASIVAGSVTSARRLVNLAVDTKVAGLGTVYGYIFSNLNEMNNATLITQYAVGLEYMLSKAMNLVVEYAELDKTAGKIQSVKASFEFEI